MTTATANVELPENLDYSACYELEIPPDAPYVTGFAQYWEDALLYDTSDIREFLTNGGLYHQRVSDTFLVAYNYHFEIDRRNLIVAHGIVHPATQVRDDYHTDESAIMSQFVVVIKPGNPAADAALRRYIRVHHMQQLPDTLRGFGQPADRNCRSCAQDEPDPPHEAAGAAPVLECPACGETFCNSCTDIDAWFRAPEPECIQCEYRPEQ